MKFIDKRTVPAPEILTTRGARKVTEYIAEYTIDKARYTSSTPSVKDSAPSFVFDSNIYGHDSVKDALVILQNKKCCFCESRITHISYGDIEHFRPKAGFSQDEADLFHKPGYFWLAYDWSNLFLSCQLCNQRYKRSFFPLKNPAKRCKINRSYSIAQEEPLFVNPSDTNPADHIAFHQEIPMWKTIEGQTTIKGLKLDREELNEMRRDTLASLITARDSYLFIKDRDIDNDIKKKIKDQFLMLLKQKIEESGQYSLMLETNFAEYLPEI
jgi:uncharacterized protein (TIGR02646 family)